MYGDADKDHIDYFVQDGDPSHNSQLAIDALKRVKATVFKIPPRSPDLNPIENVFHLAKNSLKNSAKNNRPRNTFRICRKDKAGSLQHSNLNDRKKTFDLWTNEPIDYEKQWRSSEILVTRNCNSAVQMQYGRK